MKRLRPCDKEERRGSKSDNEPVTLWLAFCWEVEYGAPVLLRGLFMHLTKIIELDYCRYLIFCPGHMLKWLQFLQHPVY